MSHIIPTTQRYTEGRDLTHGPFGMQVPWSVTHRESPAQRAPDLKWRRKERPLEVARVKQGSMGEGLPSSMEKKDPGSGGERTQFSSQNPRHLSDHTL